MKFDDLAHYREAEADRLQVIQEELTDGATLASSHARVDDNATVRDEYTMTAAVEAALREYVEKLGTIVDDHE